MRIHIPLLCLLLSSPVFAQTAENVLLVINESSAISMEAGMYYAKKRSIPQSNILRIKTAADESVSRENFQRQIDAPIAAWLTRSSAHDRVLYIVLTKGVPLRISGSSGKEATTASVDSELALLYRRMLGQTIPSAGPVKNPYFLSDTPVAQAKLFNHDDQDIYLVSRLDGYNIADIRGLIDRGAAPSRQGKILLDAKGSSDAKGGAWLQIAADLLRKMGFKDRVVFENTEKVLTDKKQVLGYYSWGSNDPAIRQRHFGFQFVPGALAGMFVSSDGRTFAESSDNWKIAESGVPQSLAADLIREGVTGIAGHVSEPYLEATIRPDILFPAYLSGFNLIESYYLAMPYLSWQTVVVGDPLCAPFRARSLDAQEIDRGLNPETELPVRYSERKLSALSAAASKQPGVSPDMIKLILRAEARMARQDTAGARQALEEVTARNDRLPGPQLLLATLYESAQEYDKAIERYRLLVEIAPENPMILNNLAYALAVRQNNPQEALPLAEKAYNLAKGNPSIADTLGWTYHLSGQDDKALKLLEEATRAAGQKADIHLHFAIVSAATGNKLAAEAALQRALEIDPGLEQREEVKQLKASLKK
ncbi:MAG: putative system TPR-repeat lipoprotein [Acidobacteria bacterium]|nr:putative system TPR-repeat lipoprotein [Acidobacteriota bacterium]